MKLSKKDSMVEILMAYLDQCYWFMGKYEKMCQNLRKIV